MTSKVKKKKAGGNSLTRSWREIRQSANRKVVTAHARKRMFRNALRGLLAVTTVALVAGGIYFGVNHWQQGMQKVNTVLPPQPLREIVFRTDGVLPKSWVEGLLALPENIDITSINIHQKKVLIEEHGQVRSAVIRRLPDSLVVEVQERRPVVRIKARDGTGRLAELLVDRDGHVYSGIGYDRHELEDLLFLAGVSLQREGQGFRRLPGLVQVDDLLQVARNDFPWLYRSWQWIDCSEPSLLTVRSAEFREIIFSVGRYTEQLRQLDMTMENHRLQMMGMQKRVDLSLRNQVVVR